MDARRYDALVKKVRQRDAINYAIEKGLGKGHGKIVDTVTAILVELEDAGLKIVSIPKKKAVRFREDWPEPREGYTGGSDDSEAN